MGKGMLALLLVALLAAAPLLSMERAPTRGLPADGQDASPTAPMTTASPEVTAGLSMLSGSFVENRGQLSDPGVVLFTRGSPLSVGFMRGCVVYTLRPDALGDAGPSRCATRPEVISFTLRFEGSNPVEPVGVGPLGHSSNYLIGNDPGRWVTGARSFQEVLYRGVYDGVDLTFRFKDGALKYEYACERAGDASRIVHRYVGTGGIALDPGSGDLLVSTEAGILRDTRPVLLDGSLGGLDRVQGAFTLLDGDACGFALPDGFPTESPVVIDPGLIWGTYYGGYEGEGFGTILECEDGSILLGGFTNSVDFPTVSGFDMRGNTSYRVDDGAIVKLNATGWPIYSTFIGGNGTDGVDGLLLEPGGTVLVAGYTNSSDFPLSADAMDPTPNGQSDTVLLRMSGDGMRILYGTFLGGSGNDYWHIVRAAGAGSVYSIFMTNSTDIGTTPGAYCSTYVGDVMTTHSIVVVRFDATLKNVTYCTYINGFCTLWLPSYAHLSACVGPSGDVYLASNTKLPGFPTTSGAAFTVFGGEADAVVLRLAPNGLGDSDLVAATYLGGSGLDYVYDMAVGADGRVYVIGVTRSRDFPCSPDALSKTRTGWSDAFLTVLDEDLSSLSLSTYFGGNQQDSFFTIALDERHGTVVVMGSTDSIYNLTATAGCYCPINGGMGDDTVSYFAVVNVSRPALEYLTFLGERYRSYFAFPNDLLMVYHDGSIVSSISPITGDSPTTPGAFGPHHNGGLMDAYIMRLDPHPCGLPGPPLGLSASRGDHTAALGWAPHTNVGYRVLNYTLYESDAPDGALRQVADLPADVTEWEGTGLPNGVTRYYFLSATNSAGEGPTANVSVRPLGLSTCPLNLTATANMDGTVSLSWSPPADDGGEVLSYVVSRGLHRSSLVQINSTAATGYLDSGPGLKMGTVHFYEVAAVNGAGVGEGNSTLAVPICLPSAPSHLAARAGDRRVSLTWDPPGYDGGSDLLGYRIYRSRTGTSWVLLVEVAESLRAFDDTVGLVNGEAVTYRVCALTAVGEGPPSGTAEATPFGLPGPPRGLSAEPNNALVTLTWAPPEDENGRPVTVYRLYRGTSPTNLLPLGTTNATRYVDTGLLNGRTYFYEVSAENEAGEGPRCDLQASATPYGFPGPPTGLEVEVVQGGVRVNWSAPEHTGGSGSLVYVVLRGGSADGLEPLPGGELTDAFELVDTSVHPGILYYYSVRASNPMRAGTSAPPKDVVYVIPPGEVGTVNASVGNRTVRLKWSAPTSNGGSQVERYVVSRGLRADGRDLVPIGETDRTEYVDTGSALENGRTYYYSVTAHNWRWAGPASRLAPATPLGTPPSPILKVRRSGGSALLTWTMPDASGTSPVTGFVVMRGESPQSLTPLAWLGAEGRFLDTSVRPGRTYYYQVRPLSQLGDGSPSEVGPVTTEQRASMGWLLAIPLIIAIVAVVSAAYVMRARSRAVALAAAASAQTPTAPAAPPVEVTVAERPSCVVEEVFVVHHDGRLVSSSARGGRRAEDADLMSGMLIAVQGIVQDGLRRSGELDSIKYGDSVILIASGSRVNLAVVVYGEPDEGLKDEVESTVRRVETTYAGVIEEWRGDAAQLPGIGDILSALIRRTERVTREDVMATVATPAVSALSAVDFYRGYVRLKVAAVNDTFGVIVDAAMEVEYDDRMLRLERVDPSGLRLRGNRVALGTIRPGERKTVAFFFDPQICQGSFIDGYLTYFDPEGARHRVEMKRRAAEVVCPIFFTKEQANTAMLRKLIAEKLRTSDLRAFRYPQEMEPSEAFKVGKLALGGFEVQAVREYVEEGPPYEAEAWYYGETKVKGYQMALRLAVVEEMQALEFHVASTAMEPITGMLAEFRRELDRVIAERYKGSVRMESRADEDLRRELAGREPLMERHGEEDNDGA